MYRDFYLRFDDQEQANAILFTEYPAVLDANGAEVQLARRVPMFRNVDVIGVLHKLPPQPMPDDYVPEALPGWHVNVRLLPDEDGSALEPFAVEPAAPRRIWG